MTDENLAAPEPSEKEEKMKKLDTQLTFDFEDGNGPVPAHHHTNPDGSVADTAWVANTARVSDTAQVSGNAWVYGTARVSGYALVSGNARVSEGEHSGSNNPVEEAKPETKEVTPCHGTEPGPFCRNCGERIND